MTFTDEDLKRLKKELAEGGETTPFRLEALLARLEAAEDVFGAPDIHDGNRKAYLKWRKAAGK